VARLAGLPPEVIARAKALLAELEEAGQVRADAGDAVQLGLFASATPDPIVTEVATLDLAHLTPLEALNLLHKWQQRAVGAGADRSARAVEVRSRSASDARGEPESEVRSRSASDARGEPESEVRSPSASDARGEPESAGLPEERE
jgi:hypothetical protein